MSVASPEIRKIAVEAYLPVKLLSSTLLIFWDFIGLLLSDGFANTGKRGSLNHKSEGTWPRPFPLKKRKDLSLWSRISRTLHWRKSERRLQKIAP